LQDILSAKFVVTGALREDGLIDNNADINIIFARAAGFVDIDIYFYPCATCMSVIFIKIFWKKYSYLVALC